MSYSSLRESIYSNIRNRLISLRKESHSTQRELAKKLLVTQFYVSKVEPGQRRMDILELKKYLDVLNYSTHQFISEIDIT